MKLLINRWVIPLKKLYNHVIKAKGDDIVRGKKVTYLDLIISVTS